MARQIIRYTLEVDPSEVDLELTDSQNNRYAVFIKSLIGLRAEGNHFPVRKELIEYSEIVNPELPLTASWFGQRGVLRDLKKYSDQRVIEPFGGTVTVISSLILELITKTQKELKIENYLEAVKKRKVTLVLDKIRNKQFDEGLNNQLLDPTSLSVLYITRLHTFYFYKIMPHDASLRIPNMSTRCTVSVRPQDSTHYISERLGMGASSHAGDGIANVLDLRIAWILDSMFAEFAKQKIASSGYNFSDEDIPIREVVPNDFTFNLSELCQSLNVSDSNADNVFRAVYRLRHTVYRADFSEAPNLRRELKIQQEVFDYQAISSLAIESTDSLVEQNQLFAVANTPKENIVFGEIEHIKRDPIDSYLDVIKRRGAEHVYVKLSFHEYKYLELLQGVTKRTKFIAPISTARLRSSMLIVIVLVCRSHVGVSYLGSKRKELPLFMAYNQFFTAWSRYFSFKRSFMREMLKLAIQQNLFQVRISDYDTANKIDALFRERGLVRVKLQGYLITLDYTDEVIREFVEGPSYRNRKFEGDKYSDPILTLERDPDDEYVGDKSRHNTITRKMFEEQLKIEDDQF